MEIPLANYELPLVAITGILFGILLATIFFRRKLRFHTENAVQSTLHACRSEQAVLEERLTHRERELDRLSTIEDDSKEQLAELTRLRTVLEQEKKSAAELAQFIEQSQGKLLHTFKALSADALKSNNQSFLDLAHSTLGKFQQGAVSDLNERKTSIDQLVKPLKESLEKVNVRMGELEKARTGAYATLTEQVKSLSQTQLKLEQETSNLVRSLRTPTVRGRWGEVQLRRVVEIAGMVEHCDFYEQLSVDTDDGKLRPDMLVKLPGDKSVVVDAKAPLEGYLESIEAATEDGRREQLKRHARHIRTHISQLSGKSYWQQFDPSPEFVVLFLPGECFFSAALEFDPTLIEYGMDNQVVVATPTTLIALLRSVAFGWDQEQITKNALEIRKLGRELFERLQIMGNHFDDMRKGLHKAVESYNKAVRSVESRVFVTARRFGEMGALNGEDLEELQVVESAPRVLQLPKSVGE